MALIPCRECGTLNSDQAEICLSCEYPIKGRTRTHGFKWLAIVLAAAFTLPLILLALDTFRQPTTPPSLPPTQPENPV